MFNFLKKLGPGILFAGAAIGVSHLVQSTKAGADFGFGLVWALLLVNLFKFPFFQYGPKYAITLLIFLLSTLLITVTLNLIIGQDHWAL